MAVYLPTAAVGNSRVLVTLGASGEIMGLFYPNIDFAQNAHECMPALYIGEPGWGSFHWTFGAECSRRQEYVPRTNILRTEVDIPSASLRLVLTDFVLPDRDVFIRGFEVVNRGLRPASVTILQYADLNLGEAPMKNSVRHVVGRHLVAQYWRDIAVAVGGDFDQARCGKADGVWGPKADMADGALDAQEQDIGDVAFALAWRVRLEVNATARRWMVAGFGRSDAQAQETALDAVGRGYQPCLEDTAAFWTRWLDQRQPPVTLSADALRRYERGLLAIGLLHDEQTGAFVAAPEFDPGYERSGGYGFCWPRDAAECVLALQAAGVNQMPEAFFRWCARTQQEDGLWGQRYWSNGALGPSWCLRPGFDQLDQGASVVAAMSRWLLVEENSSVVASELWGTIERGVEGLRRRLTWGGLHDSACDPWESFEGTFTYTNAAIHAALRESAKVAQAQGLAQKAAEWEGAAAAVKDAVLTRLWLGDRFARGARADGSLDTTYDSSVFGAIWPFRLLDLDCPHEREMAATMLEVVGTRLAHPHGGILRYEGEHYLGGVIGCVNTLWLARCLLLLAEAAAHTDRVRAEGWVRRAEELVRFCESRATPTGLMPELIGTDPSTPYWAAPHGWATGLHITCLLALGRLAQGDG
jgi:glucoamylase